VTDRVAKQRTARWLLLAAGAIVVAAAVLLWRYTPLAQWADLQRVAEWMETWRDSFWAPFIVIAAYVIGGLIAFPLTLLITATAIVFDPWAAIVLSLAGSIASAVTSYALGRRVVRETVMRAFGDAVAKLRGFLQNSGIIAVATIRMVPIAPFTLVNLAAGAIGVPVRDYLIGTILGLLPGTIALTAFGRQLRQIAEHPTLTNVGLLAAAVLGWISLSLLLQRWVSRRNQRANQHGTKV
jgi:phospholipase D1/2